MPVIFILIDGLRPDAITAERCPRLAGLRARGAATMRASSVMPSITLPCHTSIFHSVPPTRHGITTNDWRPMARPLPGLFDIARAAGKRSVLFYNWEQLRDLGFVYFGTVDTAGHVYGWMSDGYLGQLEQVDAALGTLLDALDADCTLLIQSDHGGHDRNHGTDLPEDLTIPWI